MTKEQLKKWLNNLELDEYVELVLFYSRLCTVCSQLDKED